jgi:hypothetical protein
MNTQEPVCDCCGKSLDDEAAVVILTHEGRQIPRHRRCHMLDLLDRASPGDRLASALVLGECVESQPCPSLPSGCADVTGALRSKSAQRGMTRPAPSLTRGLASVVAGTSCAAHSGSAKLAAGMSTPSSLTTGLAADLIRAGKHPPSDRRRLRLGRKHCPRLDPRGSPSQNQGPPNATGAAGGPST